MFKDIISGNAIGGEIDLKSKDGSEFLSYFTATTLRKNGKIIGLTGSVKNLSEDHKTVVLLLMNLL